VQSFRRGRSDGIRIGAAAGSPVLAAEAGEVLRITRDTDQVQILLLRHPNGLLTIYGNVTDIRVAQGDRVRRGQRLAAVASSDPAFLHFEVRDGTTPVDPVPYLE
jgi:murein DD-endopeptidase MepM/ murein hydrolase activator NlpD